MEDNCNVRRWDLLKRKLNNIPVEEFEAFMSQNPDTILIDCRKPEEHVTIRIPNSKNFNYLSYDFWDELEQLPLDKTYLVYCNTCRRSIRSCTLMQNGGFQHVYNLDGGLREWLEKKGEAGLIRGEE